MRIIRVITEDSVSVEIGTRRTLEVSRMVDIEYLKSRIKEVREVIGELLRISSKPYKELNLDERYSMRYQIVVLVETLGSLCLHIAAEEFGSEPKSYSECFNLLENRGGIKCSEDLTGIVRLRNLWFIATGL